ncbi:unnamed protein product, partial [Symbiodinium sp. KB8]
MTDVEETKLSPTAAAGEDSDDEVEVPRVQLHAFEKPVRFSKSHIWSLMKSYYDSLGIKAWEGGSVPSFITSNAFIARTYARMIYSFALDMYDHGDLDPSEPLYVLELGTGHGKFSYLLVKALYEHARTFRGKPLIIRLIMTDFTDSNFRHWQQQSCFHKYLDAGVLDFAIFDADNRKPIHLWRSKEVLEPGKLKNPVVAIANYLFDTLLTDAFKVCTTMYEARITCGSTQEKEPDPLDPDIIERMANLWSYIPIPKIDGYYKDEGADGAVYESILKWYSAYFEAYRMGEESAAVSRGTVLDEATRDWYSTATVLLPYGGLKVIRFLRELSNNRLMVRRRIPPCITSAVCPLPSFSPLFYASLSSAFPSSSFPGLYCCCLVVWLFGCARTQLISADKGNSHPDSFIGSGDPHIAIHGSFSVMANYHALGLYFESLGGFHMHARQEEASLKCCAFVLPGEKVGKAVKEGESPFLAQFKALTKSHRLQELDLSETAWGNEGSSSSDGASGAGGKANAAGSTSVSGSRGKGKGGSSSDGKEEGNSSAGKKGSAAAGSSSSARLPLCLRRRETCGLPLSTNEHVDAVGGRHPLPWTHHATATATAARFTHLTEAYQQNVESFGPEDFYMLQASVKV